ncbi:TfoX/Sxy family protein [Anaerosporobacter sp.]
MSNKKLKDLPNIGKVVEQQLNMVGITTEEELKNIGAKQAWLRIQKIDESACINRLYGLEGAIEGIKKTGLSEDMKKDLKDFYNVHRI